jgi:hypothetical protein
MKNLTNTQVLRMARTRLRRMIRQAGKGDWRMEVACRRAVIELQQVFTHYGQHIDRPSKS